MIGFTSLLFALQSWLGETPEQKEASSTPAYFGVLMSIMAVGVVSNRIWCVGTRELLMHLCIDLYAAVSSAAGRTRGRRGNGD